MKSWQEKQTYDHWRVWVNWSGWNIPWEPATPFAGAGNEFWRDWTIPSSSGGSQKWITVTSFPAGQVHVLGSGCMPLKRRAHLFCAEQLEFWGGDQDDAPVHPGAVEGAEFFFYTSPLPPSTCNLNPILENKLLFTTQGEISLTGKSILDTSWVAIRIGIYILLLNRKPKCVGLLSS